MQSCSTVAVQQNWSCYHSTEQSLTKQYPSIGIYRNRKRSWQHWGDNFYCITNYDGGTLHQITTAKIRSKWKKKSEGSKGTISSGGSMVDSQVCTWTVRMNMKRHDSPMTAGLDIYVESFTSGATPFNISHTICSFQPRKHTHTTQLAIDSITKHKWCNPG